MARRPEILAKVRSIGAMPAAAVEAIRLAQDPDVDIAKLTRAIEYDPGLTSNVLRLANSAFFGFRRAIASIREAIVRLGMIRIVSLVAASSFAPLARRRIRGYDLPPGQLWRHSVASAIGSLELAQALGLRAPDQVFTAALLHDIGKVALGTFVEVAAEPIMALAFRQKVAFDAAERQVLGIDHAELGAVLLEDWRLPPGIVEAVAWHHLPTRFEGKDRLVTDLVHVADQICLVGGIGAGADGSHYRPSEEAVSGLRVTTRVIETVTCRILSGLSELGDLLAGETGE